MAKAALAAKKPEPKKAPLRTAKTSHKNKLYIFTYEGTDKAGKRLKGEIYAVNSALAKVDLRRQGIIPTKVTKKAVSIFNRAKKIKPKDIALFSRQLATMLKAGVPLVESFDIVSKGHTNPSLQTLLQDVKNDVESGASLAEALSKRPQYFDDLFCNLIAAGEQSGTLEIMLDRVATYKEKTESLKGKVKKALFYPIAVISVAIVVTLVLLIFVVPQFEQLFKNFGANLPVFTQFVLGLSRAIQNYWWVLILLIIGIVMGFNEARGKVVAFQEFVDKAVLKLYVVGDILYKSAIARFARTLSTTFAAGVPLLEGLSSVAGTSGNSVFRQAIEQIAIDVSTGQQLQLAMRSSRIFPHMVVQMVAIGEEAGSLDEMLNKVADFYEEEVDNKVDALSSLLEPAIIVILGVLVGGLVVAMYLPIFKMGSVVG